MVERAHDPAPTGGPVPPGQAPSAGPDPDEHLDRLVRATRAATVAELYGLAREAQAVNAWSAGLAAVCKARREALLDRDEAALALLERELGATRLAGGSAA